MLPKNDHLILGIIIGLLFPVLGYFLALQSNDWISSAMNRAFTFKESTTVLFGICMNMFPLGYFRRRRYDKALRGVLVTTMVLAVIWFVKFGAIDF